MSKLKLKLHELKNSLDHITLPRLFLPAPPWFDAAPLAVNFGNGNSAHLLLL